MDLTLERLHGITDIMDRSLLTPSTFTANFKSTYDILNFKEEDIDINFIAMSLSKQCRYIGHVGETIHSFYSVAQHSVMMSEAILLTTGNPKRALEALLHDSAEAYIGDLASPLKKLVKDIVKPVEDAIEKVIFNYYGLEFPMNPLIKHVDVNICKYELTFAVHNTEPEKQTFDFWTINESYDRFLGMFHRLLKLIRIDGIIETKNNVDKNIDSVVELRKQNFVINSHDGLSRVLLFKYLGFEFYKKDGSEDTEHFLVNIEKKQVTCLFTKKPKNLQENFAGTLRELIIKYPEGLLKMRDFIEDLKYNGLKEQENCFGFTLNNLQYETILSDKDQEDLMQGSRYLKELSK